MIINFREDKNITVNNCNLFLKNKTREDSINIINSLFGLYDENGKVNFKEYKDETLNIIANRQIMIDDYESNIDYLKKNYSNLLTETEMYEEYCKYHEEVCNEFIKEDFNNSQKGDL